MAKLVPLSGTVVPRQGVLSSAEMITRRSLVLLYLTFVLLLLLPLTLLFSLNRYVLVCWVLRWSSCCHRRWVLACRRIFDKAHQATCQSAAAWRPAQSWAASCAVVYTSRTELYTRMLQTRFVKPLALAGRRWVGVTGRAASAVS